MVCDEETPLLTGDSSSSNSTLYSSTSSDVPSSDNTSSGRDLTCCYNLSCRQMIVGVTTALLIMFLAVSFAAIAPFFPKEAQQKGVTTFETGFIFGIYPLTKFFTSPIYGSKVKAIGAKKMFLTGTTVCALSILAFGLLEEINNRITFVILCVTCRIVQANGSGMGMTAGFAIMATQFPDQIAIAMGTLEAFAGLGMVIGPSMGGGLYYFGGYKLPFIVICTFLLLCTVIAFIVMPTVDDVVKVQGRFVDFLKIPGCVVIFICMIGIALGLTFLDPIFTDFLKSNFGLSIGTIGLVFMVESAFYATSTPICGHLCDKYNCSGVLVSIGLIINGISFLLIGPCPLVKSYLPKSLVGTILSQIVCGITSGMICVPLMPLILSHVKYKGYVDGIHTYGLVSGFFNSAFSLGAFFGPTAAGFLVSKVDFEWANTICGLLIIALGLIMSSYLLLMKYIGLWPLPIPVESTEEKEHNQRQT